MQNAKVLLRGILRHHRHRGGVRPDYPLLRLLLSLRHQGHGWQEDRASCLDNFKYWVVAGSHKIDVAHDKMFEIIYSLHHRLNQRGQPDPRPGLTFLFLSFRLNYIHYTYTCYNK